MKSSIQIAFIGTGNMAWHLSQALENAGHPVIEVYGRNLKKAAEICSMLYDAAPTDSLDFSESAANLYIIAVSDEAIDDIAGEIILPDNAFVIHTSGSQPMHLLEKTGVDFGIFYPVQTFSKGIKVDFEEIPVCIEASSQENAKFLTGLAKTITSKVSYLDSTNRQILHLSAVFACNFSNHLLTIAKGLMESNGLNFDLLEPLINETINKSLKNGPENSQTGPAVRNDFDTISKHLVILKEEEHLISIYNAMTKDIIKTHL